MSTTQINDWQARLDQAAAILTSLAREVGITQMQAPPRSEAREDLDHYRSLIEYAADACGDAHTWGAQFVTQHTTTPETAA